jgi:hypothetical protein
MTETPGKNLRAKSRLRQIVCIAGSIALCWFSVVSVLEGIKFRSNGAFLGFDGLMIGNGVAAALIAAWLFSLRRPNQPSNE